MKYLAAILTCMITTLANGASLVYNKSDLQHTKEDPAAKTRTTTKIAPALKLPGTPNCAPTPVDPGVSVEGAWVEAGAEGQQKLSAYLTIINDTDKLISLVGGESDHFGQLYPVLHSTTDGTVRTTQVKGLTVPFHGKVTLSPASARLVIHDPVHRLLPGEVIWVNLLFDDGTALRTRFEVHPNRNSSAPASQSHREQIPFTDDPGDAAVPGGEAPGAPSPDPEGLII